MARKACNVLGSKPVYCAPLLHHSFGSLGLLLSIPIHGPSLRVSVEYLCKAILMSGWTSAASAFDEDFLSVGGI